MRFVVFFIVYKLDCVVRVGFWKGVKYFLVIWILRYKLKLRYKGYLDFEIDIFI